MKSNKIVLWLITTIFILTSTSCNQVHNGSYCLDALDNFVEPNYEASYYNNMQFNAYYNPEEANNHLPNQGIYGSGNAYILRYNGMYYMYMGSSNTQDSKIPCYQSKDLMTWEEVNNGVNALGKVAEDNRLYNAYPPCVKQYNSQFYMYIYLKNDFLKHGNYILKASSPIGPFSFVTDENNDPICYSIEETKLNIDCDIFIDDNEEIYFMSGHQDNYFSGIRAFKMPSMDTILYDEDSYVNLANTSIGGWTEGNGIFKRNGIYYLMYTGSNILSPGYLTHYSTCIDDSWKKGFASDQKVNSEGFNQGIDYPMGCETQDTFYSLGHATSILGPDMDGLYYHYFSVNSTGPNCSFAIDRLIFNGSSMDSAQTQYHSITPKMPQLYTYNPLTSDEFIHQGNFLLSNQEHSKNFTCEFNFKNSSTRCIFNYNDENHYQFIQVDLNQKKILLFQLKDGKEQLLASGNIIRDYDAENGLLTVRVAVRDGKADVYFDDLLKISNHSLSSTGGKMGYLYQNNTTFGFTAFSNVAKGLSDAIEPKLSYINIGAESYLPQGIYENAGSIFHKKSGLSYTNKKDYQGKYERMGQMNLKVLGDQATYLVDFDGEEDDIQYQMLYLTANKAMSGKVFGVRVDGSPVYVLKFPEISPTNDADLIKVAVGKIPVKKGIRQISFIQIQDSFSFHSFSFGKASNQNTIYREKLDKAPQYGMEQKTLYRFEKQSNDQEASLTSKEGARSLVYFGDSSLKDYRVECDFRLNGESVSTAGFILEGNRYSNSFYVDEDYKYIQGYYIALNRRMAKIEKLNYNHSDTGAKAERITLTPDTWNHIEIIKKKNEISITITNHENQSKTLAYVDDISFVDGRFGFYSAGASMSYKNLLIEGY